MPAAELVCWGQCAEQGRAGGLVLADGGCWWPTSSAADKERLTADSELFGTLKLPLESLAGVVFHPPSARPIATSCFDRLARADRRRPTACCWTTATN